MRSNPVLPRELSFALYAIIATVSAANLPYNPTIFLVSPPNPSVAYVFRPVSSSGPQFQLSRLDLSSSISSKDLSYTAVQAKLPFLNDTKSIPFVTAIDGDGVISVLAGDCSQGANAAKVWRLDTGGSSGKVGSTWTQLSSNSNGLVVPEYLSSAIIFPNSISGSTKDYKEYVFGGMCPYNNSTSSTWTSSADYSKTITKLGIAGNQFDTSTLAPRNPPVAQAGHSLTPLTPTFSNRTDGSHTTQQNFLLLGGHTGSAFLNLSQAALFSLPQETWTYLPISATVGKVDASSITPRSGHTATLSSDGKYVVVFGGWIGDVNTPASPQLVVLNVADGYGGSGNWAWSMPLPQGSAPQPGGGLYGHGTLMLPGNVMLITGGYSMSSKSGSRKRDSSQQLNTNSYLYNITSNSWISTYNAPLPVVNAPISGSKASKKLGIGIGLSLAAVTIIGLLIFYLWYQRRSRWKRELREEQLRAMKEGYVSDEWGMGGVDGQERFYRHAGAPGMHPPAATMNRGRPGSRGSGKAVLTGDASNSSRGPKRNSTGGRGPYAYERSRNRDSIHPIIEGVEESTDGARKEGHTSQTTERELGINRESSVDGNPFIDPLSSHSVDSRQRPISGISLSQEQEQEIETWSTQWAKAGNEMMRGAEKSAADAGRVSPTKSDCTMSSMSSVSAITSRSQQSAPGPVGIVRSLSYRSAAILSSLTNPFAAGPSNLESTSPTEVSPISVNKSVYSKKGPNGNQNQGVTQLDFARLQAESESLLGAHPSGAQRSRPLPQEPGQHVPSRRTAPTGSWVGSVRRVIGMSSNPNARSTSLTTASTKTRQGAVKNHQDRMSLASASGASAVDSGVLIPRRSASDAAFWKSKRGAKDWGDDDTNEGEEWDVETAAQNRVVQLMFTVPRERLRVVNADVDGRSIISAEEAVAATTEEEQQDSDANWERL